MRLQCKRYLDQKHLCVNHGQHGFTRGNCHINGIESFLLYANEGLQNSMMFHEKLFIYT